MRRTRLGFAIGAVITAAAGATYYVGGIENILQLGFLHKDSAHLKDKERQVSEKIHKMVENETDELGSTSRKEKGEDPSTFEVVVGKSGGAQDQVPTTAETDKSCSAIEYAGSGPDSLRLDSAVWNRFMADYHRAKEDLVDWLHRNAESFPKAQMARMELEIRETRVMRPQSQVEPDLAWRGIAAWTRPRPGTIVENERPALIHVSDGFMKLYQKDRSRARFEITRVLAQAWAPCEMGAGKFTAWNGLLQCLGVSAEQVGCTAGVVSEGAWAASTAVAVLVSPPSCDIPAFQGDKYQACLGGLKRSESAGYEIEKAGRKVASQSAREE
jgi:hypothetical protein